MIECLRQRVGRLLPLEALVAGASLERIAAALARVEPSTTSPLVRFRPGRGRPPLICIHPAGGSALCDLELARRLPSSQPVFGLQEPGHAGLADASIEDRATAYLAEIQSVCRDVRWHLAAHSFGGLVAFEMARQLAAAGQPPGVVAIIDTAAPVIVDGVRAEDPLVRRLGAILDAAPLDGDVAADSEAEARTWDALAACARATLAAGSDEPCGDAPGRFGAIQRFCRRYQFLPAASGMGYAELRQFLQSMRSAFRAARRYAPGPYAGRVTLFQATDCPGHSRDDAAAAKRLQAERWAAIVAGGCDVRAVPAHHFDLLGPPHVDALATGLAAAIASA